MYLKKLTQQVYLRQRQFDQFRLLYQLSSEKDRTKEIHNLIRQVDQNNNDNNPVDPLHQTNIDKTTKYADLEKSQEEEELQTVFETLEAEQDLIQSNLREITRLDFESSNAHKRFASAAQQELEIRFQLAYLEAENKVMESRVDRMKASLQELQYEPSPSMYKGYKNAFKQRLVQESASENKKMIAANTFGEVCHKKELELQQLIIDCEVFRKFFEKSINHIKKDLPRRKNETQLLAITTTDNNLDNDNTKSLNSPTSTTAFQQIQIKKSEISEQEIDDPLTELNSRRQMIFDDCAKEAAADLGNQKTNLVAEVSLLNAEIKANCAEIGRRRRLIKKNELRSEDIRQKISKIQKDQADKSAEKEIKVVADSQLEQKKLEALEKDLQLLIVSVTNLENKRNQLNEQIIQAKVDESNLSNRFQTFDSMKKSKKSGFKVEKTRNELDSLQEFLLLSRQKNRPTRRKLGLLKTYYIETAQKELLEHRKRQLETIWEKSKNIKEEE
uniref:DUF4200 domain-containing protein n=1 Tax=Ditylenchus dipsaci TaxID=166011 RepID=A0A915ECA6_9BILA